MSTLLITSTRELVNAALSLSSNFIRRTPTCGYDCPRFLDYYCRDAQASNGLLEVSNCIDRCRFDGKLGKWFVWTVHSQTSALTSAACFQVPLHNILCCFLPNWSRHRYFFSGVPWTVATGGGQLLWISRCHPNTEIKITVYRTVDLPWPQSGNNSVLWQAKSVRVPLQLLLHSACFKHASRHISTFDIWYIHTSIYSRICKYNASIFIHVHRHITNSTHISSTHTYTWAAQVIDSIFWSLALPFARRAFWNKRTSHHVL